LRSTDVARASADLVLAVAAEQIVGALREAGVRSILLKGPVHARWLYEEGARRAYSDIDLLAPAGELDRAEVVLEELGFTYLYDDGNG
jgi:hypothetical protein